MKVGNITKQPHKILTISHRKTIRMFVATISHAADKRLEDINFLDGSYISICNCEI